MTDYCARILTKCRALSIAATDDVLHVSIREQSLRHYQQGGLISQYKISTSRKPPSCLEDSEGTPTGLHYIDEKMGVDAPCGMIFKGRVAQGITFFELSVEANEPNKVTTRICWLRGLEKAVNAGPGVDSHARYIYIHGTNHEAALGTPQSHGCILMNNVEIIQLFEQVPSGTQVLIEL